MLKIREFSDRNEAIKYAEDNWSDYFESLRARDENLFNLVISMKSSGRRSTNYNDIPVINAVNKVIREIPSFKEDVYVFRGGHEEDFCGDRPFLATSFLEDTGKEFSVKANSKLFRIHIHKGAKGIPICGIKGLEYKHEQEIVLESKNIHRYGEEYEYYHRFYKLFILDDGKIYSKFGDCNPIKMNEEYSSAYLGKGLGISFSSIDHILNFKGEHGTIVCDVIPRDILEYELEDNDCIENACDTVIVKNPRSIYSPDFIQELTEKSVSYDAWDCMFNLGYVISAIHNCKNRSDEYKLDFSLADSLRLILLKEYSVQPNDRIKGCIIRRKEFDYLFILNQARKYHAKRDAKKVIVSAWNKYKPCLKSRLYALMYLV